ncbi:expressed protein, partial [Dictyostelium purpureum]
MKILHFFILLVISNFVYISNSQSILQIDEYNRVEKLLKVVLVESEFSTRFQTLTVGVNTFWDFCSSSDFECISIGGEYYASTMTVRGQETVSTINLDYSYFKNFKHLTSISFTSLLANYTLFGNDLTDTGYSPIINVENCRLRNFDKLPAIPSPTNKFSIVVNTDSPDYSISKLPLSSLKNIKTFSFSFSDTPTITKHVKYNNDLTSPISLDSFSSSIGETPSFNFVTINSLSLDY